MDVGSRVQTIIERRDKHFLISKRLFLFFDFHINKIAIKFFELINIIGYLIYFSSEDNIAKGFFESTDYLGYFIRDEGNRVDGSGGGRECWIPASQSLGPRSYTRPPRNVVWNIIMRPGHSLLSLIFRPWLTLTCTLWRPGPPWPRCCRSRPRSPPRRCGPWRAESPPHRHRDWRQRHLECGEWWHLSRYQANTHQSGWAYTPPGWGSSWCPGDTGRGRGGGACSPGSLQCCTDCSTGSSLWQRLDRRDDNMGSPASPGLQCNTRRNTNLNWCKMCIFTLYYKLWVLVWKVSPDFYSYLSPNFFMACCGPRLSAEAPGDKDKFLIVLLFSHLASYIQLYLNW